VPQHLSPQCLCSGCRWGRLPHRLPRGASAATGSRRWTRAESPRETTRSQPAPFVLFFGWLRRRGRVWGFGEGEIPPALEECRRSAAGGGPDRRCCAPATRPRRPEVLACTAFALSSCAVSSRSVSFLILTLSVRVPLMRFLLFVGAGAAVATGLRSPCRRCFLRHQLLFLGSLRRVPAAASAASGLRGGFVLLLLLPPAVPNRPLPVLAGSGSSCSTSSGACSPRSLILRCAPYGSSLRFPSWSLLAVLPMLHTVVSAVYFHDMRVVDLRCIVLADCRSFLSTARIG